MAGADPSGDEQVAAGKDEDPAGEVRVTGRTDHEVGNPQQREQAQAVLTKARQALYKILAADDEPTDAV